ncbi:DUF6538 domain-containing protein [Rhizobium flavescens]|nr:DUF6538 domain-containing protein [Rhizobium flavescens]
MNGGGWRVVVDVPRNLRKQVGKTKLKQALGTDSLATANVLKHAVVARLKAELEAYSKDAPSDPLMREAMALRAALEAAGRGAGALDEVNIDAIADAVKRRAEEIQGRPIGGDEGEEEYEPNREARAQAFADVALGNVTPLDLPVPTFLLEKKKWGPRTVADFERVLGYLKAWLRENQYQGSIEVVTRRVAGDFVSSRLIGGDLASKTINKYVTGLSGYWKWLMTKGYVETNVWTQQRAEKERPEEGNDMRSFDDEELERLFSGKPKRGFVYDAMVIAALTGARMGVIVDLTVADCQGDQIRFRAGKHEKHSRLVPMHPDLRGVIASRVKGKGLSDDLFPEMPRLAPGDDPRKERGQRLTKSFGTFRNSVGVDDPRPSDGKSRVNFHSFRRWFISRASSAINEGAVGFSPWTIAEVVAHSKGDMPLDMTMGHYKAPDAMKARRACVEAVQLSAKARAALLERYPSPQTP